MPQLNRIYWFRRSKFSKIHVTVLPCFSFSLKRRNAFLREGCLIKNLPLLLNFSGKAIKPTEHVENFSAVEEFRWIISLLLFLGSIIKVQNIYSRIPTFFHSLHKRLIYLYHRYKIYIRHIYTKRYHSLYLVRHFKVSSTRNLEMLVPH